MALRALARMIEHVMPARARRLVTRRYYLKLALKPEADLDIAARLIDRGDTVVDVGAAIGTYTVAFARWVGPKGRVLAFEPMERTADTLTDTIATLGFRHVQIHRCAASDRTGTGVMSMPDYNKYQAYLGAGDIPVRLVRLDDVVQRVSFLKIDAEEHELGVLMGALQLLESRPAILLEMSDGRVCDVLRPRGYEPFFYEGGVLHPWTRGSVNVFFLTEDHSRRLAGAS